MGLAILCVASVFFVGILFMVRKHNRDVGVAFYVGEDLAFVSINGMGLSLNSGVIESSIDLELVLCGAWKRWKLVNVTPEDIFNARALTYHMLLGKKIMITDPLYKLVNCMMAVRFIRFLEVADKMTGIPNEDGLTLRKFEEFMEQNPGYFEKY